MFSPFVPWSADECIRAFECEGEKPHQGVAPQKTALHPGIAWSNSTNALGLQSLAVENGVRSRCTGKERDTESSLDYFGARYFGSSLGRFMTPDWAAKPTAVPYAHYGNPQSLNLYSYVQNNPTTTGDPDGHCPDSTKCKNVTVTADPPEQKAPPTEITITAPGGKVSTGTGPIAHITFTVKVNGKGVDGVKVTESNKDKLTINGKVVNESEKIEGKGVTKDGGQIR